jgi:hypothetical protein
VKGKHGDGEGEHGGGGGRHAERQCRGGGGEG